MEKTIKEIVKDVVSACPIGRVFSREDLYKSVCRASGRTVSKKYVYELLKSVGEELRIADLGCYRMPKHTTILEIRSRVVYRLKFDPNCIEEYLRKVLGIIFECVAPNEVFALSGFRKIINNVVPFSAIKGSLPQNLDQVIASICKDKEREWNLNVSFPENRDLCTVEKIVPKINDKVCVKTGNEDQLNRLERKLDEILFILKPKPVTVNAETIKVDTVVATPIGPFPITPTAIAYYQSSTAEDTNFLLKSETI